MNGFRFPESSNWDDSRRRKLGVSIAVAAGVAISIGMVLIDGPHGAAVAAEPALRQVAAPPVPTFDPSVPAAATVINAIAGNPDPDAPTF